MIDPLRTPFVYEPPAWDGFINQTLIEEIVSRQRVTQTADKLMTYTSVSPNVADMPSIILIGLGVGAGVAVICTAFWLGWMWGAEE